MDSTAAKVVVYSTDPCSFCARVKGILAKRGVDFVEVNLTKDPAGRVELVQKTGMMSFPQVVVGDHLVGGFKELLAAEQDGRLDELLADSGNGAEQPPPGPPAA